MREWAEWWRCDDPYATEWPSSVPPLPRLTRAQVRAAISTFPAGTGVGADNISPRALARLSDEAIDALIELYSKLEEAGTWSDELDLVLIVLLGKSDGGRRPIGLFPTLIRVWMRARTPLARGFENANADTCIYGSAGMGAQRAAWCEAFRAEAAALAGGDQAQVLLDGLGAPRPLKPYRTKG